MYPPGVDRIYHLATGADWAQASRAGGYRAPTLATEGFCHCSFAHQLEATADRYFRGARELVLLVIRVDRLDVPFKVEANPGKVETFPHVYGVIPLAAIEASHPVPAGPDGRLRLPTL